MSTSTSVPTVPIAVIIFNRPDFAATVFDHLALAQPSRLLIIADGPRNPAEASRCAASRAVFDHIPWPCEVSRNYADTNLGCYQRIVSGLDWVFSLVDRAIILEDDMVPDPSLFPFVSEMLARFEDDPTVFTIGGYNTAASSAPESASYRFSHYPMTWGWGTWARAWRQFDGRLTRWPEMRRQSWLRRTLRDPHATDFFTKIFDAAAAADTPGRFPTPWSDSLVDAWDYIWIYSIFANRGRCIVPSVNMITNIGFREDSTHVKNADSHLARLQAAPTAFPLIPPVSTAVDHAQDAEMFARWQAWRCLTPWQQVRFRMATWPPARRAYHLLRSALSPQ
jgi:hypothetical protein